MKTEKSIPEKCKQNTSFGPGIRGGNRCGERVLRRKGTWWGNEKKLERFFETCKQKLESNLQKIR
jgi:hypothetical protein